MLIVFCFYRKPIQSIRVTYKPLYYSTLSNKITLPPPTLCPTHVYTGPISRYFRVQYYRIRNKNTPGRFIAQGGGWGNNSHPRDHNRE